jgi:hypothetical protein
LRRLFGRLRGWRRFEGVKRAVLEPGLNELFEGMPKRLDIRFDKSEWSLLRLRGADRSITHPDDMLARD